MLGEPPKAIETQYNGYRFRSRLEARWAVYFDAIGLEWEYEKEGLQFEDGTRYLPDFWLPQVKMWAEVKPKDKELDPDAIRKLELLANGTGHPCIMLAGVPDVRSYDAYNPEDIQHVVISSPGTDGRLHINVGADNNRIRPGSWPQVCKAVRAARSAQFEFKLNDAKIPEAKKDEPAKAPAVTVSTAPGPSGPSSQPPGPPPTAVIRERKHIINPQSKSPAAPHRTIAPIASWIVTGTREKRLAIRIGAALALLLLALLIIHLIQLPAVWVNTNSGIYHMPGSRWYGKTKQGVYMKEDEAIRRGYRKSRSRE